MGAQNETVIEKKGGDGVQALSLSTLDLPGCVKLNVVSLKIIVRKQGSS